MAINKNVLAEKQATVLSEDGNTMYATIQMRHGKESDMDKSKFVPAEIGVTTDTKKAFMAFSPGNVKEMMFREDSEIEELLGEVRKISDQAVEAVESAEATAKQTIEDYTEQMKATIPEDYTEMVKKVDILERTKAPAIHQTATGNPITLTDAAEGTPVVDFAMDGKTEQVQTTGAQLFDASKLKTKTQGNVTITNNGDGSFTVTGSGNVPGTEYPSIMLSKEESLKLIKPGTLRLAENSDVRPCFMAGLRNTQTNAFRKTVGNQLRLSIEITEDDIQKIESGQDVFSYCFYDNADVQIVPGTIKPMVYIGDNPQIPWEPYRTPQTLTLQSNRPLTKWDRMEKRDGQWGWVFNSNNIVFDGSEDENWMKHSNNRFYIAISDKIGSGLNGEKNYLCNKLIPFNTNIGVINMPNNTIKESGILGQKNMYLRIDEAGNDVESFKTWLQSNSLLIWYKTAEETFVPLTTPEQSALEALTTYFPTTIITVEDGELAPEIEVEYVADTKTYIDNKFAELAENLVATQNTLLEV